MTTEERSIAARNEVAITCGTCGKVATFDAWVETPITGPLPRGVYQCPGCKRAFRRQANPDHARKPWLTPIQCVPVPSYL